MIKLYKKLENIWFSWPQKLRFVLVGGFNTFFSYLLFVFMVEILKIPYKAAIIIGYIISTNLSVLTMRYYVFQSVNNLKKEYFKGWGVYLTMLALNYVFMFIAVDILRQNKLIAQAIYTVLAPVAVYFAHRDITFHKTR
ncbi:MAG: GtrA family protein [Alphaproteobacteria bacterium]|nr:GtrA family protein [Alphaproteobacteria bacterium]